MENMNWLKQNYDIDIESISSEEETGSEYDGGQRIRTKSISEICPEESILNALQNLNDAEDIFNLLSNYNNDNGELYEKNTISVFLISAWYGKIDILEKLLSKDQFLINAIDHEGRTALHLAVATNNTEVLLLLLKNGAEVDKKDFVNQATALHYSASKGYVACLKLLLQYGAEVNCGLNIKSSLFYAVESGSVECVRELLQHQAIPNTSQVYSETPLHVASARGLSPIVNLLIKHGAAVNVQSGTEKLTPLHLASEDSDPECARLLIEAGANISCINHKKQTPLHLAALSQCSATLELLLSKGANCNACDVDGRTPLHCAIVKVSRSCECVRLLIQYGANVNQSDNFGYTPLHLAALNEFSNCVMLLLNNGGDVTARTNGGVSVLTFITRKTPDVIPQYKSKFDASIRVNDHEIGDVDCELKLDFRILVPTSGNKEMELLLNFIEVGHKEFLKHPLCETFLYLKWIRIRKFFLFSLFYHSVFVVLYTIYIMEVYLKDCPARRSYSNPCGTTMEIEIFGYLLIGFNVLLLGKEIFQIVHSWLNYIKQWENWLQWLIIISVFCCVEPRRLINIKTAVYHWQHHVAAIGIFLAWVELMIIVGRFPVFGLYIQMFTRVAVNFIKFVAAYFFLLIAFALSFGVLFANYKSFKDLKWVIIKVLVMMSGELEYEDIFYDSQSPIIYNWTAQIMFLSYVILVTVILTNLTVGLAVSDIQGLQKSAGLDRLIRQAQLVAHLESMLFSPLLKWLPYRLIRFFHKKANLLASHYQWALYIKPNDPREARIPKEMIRNIYHLVAERKDKPKRRSCMAANGGRLRYSGSYGIKEKSKLKLKQQLDIIQSDFMQYYRLFKDRINELNECLTNIKNQNNEIIK